MSPLGLEDLHHKHLDDQHQTDLRIHELSGEVERLRRRVQQLEDWQRSDSERSRWLYDHEAVLREMTENAKSLHRIKAWVIGLAGLIGGALVVWQSLVVPLLRGLHP